MNNSAIEIPGKELADTMLADLAKFVADNKLGPVLNIFYDQTNQVSAKYVSLKQDRARQVGIKVVLHEINDLSQIEFIKLIDQVSVRGESVIIQLPLPNHFATDVILKAIPESSDVDVLNRSTDQSLFTQPVAGAIQSIFNWIGQGNWSWLLNKSVHVVGHGFLVGQPIVKWLESIGVQPVIYQKGSDLMNLKAADVVISGVGSRHLVKPDMIRSGAVLLDAGTSSASGELAGDIDPDCYKKSSYYTPVPGGVGPLTLAWLFKNVIKQSFDNGQ